MWVSVCCPRPSCSFTVRINGIGTCGACRALLCYKPSPRRRSLEFGGHDAWGWRPDPKGPERVHPEVDGRVVEERGTWIKLPGTRLVFPPKADRRRTAHSDLAWSFIERRNRRIG
jgi:hypothetical protein